MKIEINTSNKTTKLSQIENILQGFIDDKMRLFRDGRHVSAGNGLHIPLDKYLASLWMVSRLLQIMDEQEIAERSGVSCEMLFSWRQEKCFNDMVTAHYRELLEDIINWLA